MAVPKKRTSKRRTAMRRAHDFIAYTSSTTICSCGAIRRAHHVCSACGMYRGVQLLKIKGLTDDAEGMADSDEGSK